MVDVWRIFTRAAGDNLLMGGWGNSVEFAGCIASDSLQECQDTRMYDGHHPHRTCCSIKVQFLFEGNEHVERTTNGGVFHDRAFVEGKCCCHLQLVQALLHVLEYAPPFKRYLYCAERIH